jgi:hypothetical protein
MGKSRARYGGPSYEVWEKDFNKVGGAIKELGAVHTDPDGFQWIDPTIAPDNLVRWYNDLRSIGYFMGYLT